MPKKTGVPPGPKSSYTADQILETVEASNVMGIRPTAKVTGIPPTTIHDWRELDGQGRLENFVTEKCVGADTDLQSPLQEIREAARAKYAIRMWEIIEKGINQIVTSWRLTSLTRKGRTEKYLT